MSALESFTDALKSAGAALIGIGDPTTTAGKIAKGVVSPGTVIAEEAYDLIARKAGLPARPTSGTAPASAASAPPSEDAELSSKLTSIKRWKGVLDSMDRTMAQKAGAAKLSQAVQVWTSGLYVRATTALESALALNHTITNRLASGEVLDQRVSDDYLRQRADALDQADNAEGYATRIQAAIQKAWAEFSAKGAPGISDYALAPITGAADAARGAARSVSGAATATVDAVTGAGNALVRAGQKTVGDTKDILKYVAWGVGGFAVLYGLAVAAPLLRPIHSNPPPRRRHRRRR